MLYEVITDIELSKPLISQGENNLASIEGPKEIYQGFIGEISVGYEASDDMDIKFQLIKKSPWTTILTVNKTVAAGSGTTKAALTIPADAVAGEYVWSYNFV